MTDAAIERLTEVAYRDSAVGVAIRAADLRHAIERIKALEGALASAVDLVERDIIRVRPSDAADLMDALAQWHAALNPTGEPRPATANFHTFTPATGDA
jgi:hypothetical protein